MNDFLDRISAMSPKRLQLLALELQEQVEAARASRQEPIAIVGMACRFPGGADDPQAFWKLLEEGRDAIREVPDERWDIDEWFDPDADVPGRMSVRHGGFLDRISDFDAAFFGISPREALTMDPQHRLMLEVAWEALEHAGIAPESLDGSSTGVFVGICNSDHFQRVLARGEDTIDAWIASGNAHSVASGRLSYFLGLRGPALSIDTACSSSLVALHSACQSLRNGEVRMAIGAGVNVMCSPETTVALTKAHMLAPDGRCKTFDASADGFSRGEGCGVLVLKRLSDARADGDNILAVIRGSATNQDGRSGGLTVPNGPAQEAVIRSALANAGLAPADINYVEAHGTGTSLGDPIEVKALNGALNIGRAPGEPLVIGSVKTNIGHLESAAGIAGVIKTVLALQHERIPPHLHFKTASPHIDWASYNVKVQPDGQAWPRTSTPRRAGVSSFGFSGTNAHVVLEEAPLPDAPLEEDLPAAGASTRRWHCLPLSARTETALVALAARHADALARGDASLAEIAYGAGQGRSHFAHRLAVVADSREAAAQALAAFAEGKPHPALLTGTAQPGQARDVAFLFTGQGSQYPGMARSLYDTEPVFREVIDRCDAALPPDADGLTLKAVMFDTEHDIKDTAAPVHRTVWTQPALFALEMGLVALWRSWGVEPAAVLGHSVGEYAAACTAGVFGLEEGLRLIAERGRLMQALPPGGTMASVAASEAQVAPAVAAYADRLSIGAINAPDSVVISGAVDAVEAVLAGFEKENIRGQRLHISLAAHSPLTGPALGAMEACAAKVTMHPPRIPVAWNVIGGPMKAGCAPDPAYWRRHLREPVRFAEGVGALHREGFTTYIDIGPHPTLTALAQRSLPEDTLFATSLRRQRDDGAELATALATLYVAGVGIDWKGVAGGLANRRAVLPGYPFERRTFWVPATPPGGQRFVVKSSAAPLASSRLPTAAPIYETLLTPNRPAWLAEHKVQGMVLVAGPVLLELVQWAAHDAFGPAQRTVFDFSIRQPLVLGEAGRSVQVALGDASGDRVEFKIHSRAADAGGAWTLHATGSLGVSAVPHTPTLDLEPIAARLPEPASGASYYDHLQDLGFALGAPWRTLQSNRRTDGEVLADLRLPAGHGHDAVVSAPPALLDGAMQALGHALPTPVGDAIYVLTAIERIQLAAKLPDQLVCHARLRDHDPAAIDRADPAGWVGDVVLATATGEVVGRLDGVLLRRATRASIARSLGAAPDESSLFYEVQWESAPASARAAGTLLEPARFVALARDRFGELSAANGMSVYESLLPDLDTLSMAHVSCALKQLGFDATPGRRFDTAAEAARLGVASRHARLFARVLGMLAEDGVLRARDAGFEVVRELPDERPVADYAAFMARHGDVDGELSTLRRCGPELARVLTGEQDPLQLLFPGGSFDEAKKLYVDSPYSRTYNATLATALEAAIAQLPAHAKLRVLEVGAGTGGTTGYVLPVVAALGADRVDYVFTDLSPMFLERAAERFSAYPFLRGAILDIERDPVSQGFEAHHYDVVIAANVLHATADLSNTLGHVKTLLAPGGLLMLQEGVAPERWVDLTFGLTEGWWLATDTDLRPDYPLIDRKRWMGLLERLGFTGAASIPDDSAKARGLAQQALMVAMAPQESRHWAIAADRLGVGEELAALLRGRGDRVTVRPADEAASLPTEGDELVYLGALDLASRAVDDAAGEAASKSLAVTTPLALLARQKTARRWLVTSGAQSVAAHESIGSSRWQAPLWGLGRVAALEHPASWGGLIDLGAVTDAREAALALLQSIDSGDGEDQIALRGDERLAARLAPMADVPPPAVPSFRQDATYVVTGGFGGLGLLAARWLADHGARHIALLGRHPDATASAVREVEAMGACVYAVQCDVADEGSLRQALDALAAQAPRVSGVLHAAADLSVGSLEELNADEVDRMLRAKVDATLLIERLTRDLPLDFTVLYSSTTALLGAAGYAHYAAANQFLDATARALDRPGRRVVSVNWGTWDAMRLASEEHRRGFAAAGLEPMNADEAFAALARLLHGKVSQAAVARIDWAVLKPLHEARRRRPLLARLGQAPVAAKADAPEVSMEFAERLAGADSATRQDMLVQFVRSEIAAVLGLESGQSVQDDSGLFELGMDSLMTVELKRRLERGVGRPLPSTLTFNYPNVTALVGFLDALFAASEEVAGASPAAGEAESLDDLSEEELEARLMAELDRAR